MRHPLRTTLLLVPLVLAVTGCTTLPDVKPFADSTAALAVAARTQYHDVADDVAALNPQQMPSETPAAFDIRKKSITDSQATFAETGKRLDALFDAMTAYAERLTNLAAAGKTGADAAQSLLDTAQEFAQIADVSGLPASTLTTEVTNAFKAIADEFTKMQAQKSLRAAADAAQPGVDMVARQFAVIYGPALKNATSSIRNTRLLEAQVSAGPNVIGFSEAVQKNYNTYYQFLNSKVAPVNPDAVGAWRGFCTEKSGACRTVDELNAIVPVEARMAAIEPIVKSYRAQVTTIEEQQAHRRQASAAVVRAVNAWALEHKKVRASLADGSSVSTFNLRAALLELDGILSKTP